MIPSVDFLGKQISFYQILAIIGIFACGLFACVQAKKRGLDVDDMIVALLLCAVGALVGGHILYGITNLPLLGQVLAPRAGNGPFRRLLERDAARVRRLRVLRRPAGRHGGGRSLLEKEEAAGRLCGRDGCLRAAVPHLRPRGLFPGRLLLRHRVPVGFVYTQNPIPQANGVRRFPVQLLEALFCLLLFLALFALLHRGLCRGGCWPSICASTAWGASSWNSCAGMHTAASCSAFPPRRSSACCCFWARCFSL